MPDLSNVMPIHIGITLFLGFFASTLGIFAARALARCLRDVYDALQNDLSEPPNGADTGNDA